MLSTHFSPLGLAYKTRIGERIRKRRGEKAGVLKGGFGAGVNIIGLGWVGGGMIGMRVEMKERSKKTRVEGIANKVHGFKVKAFPLPSS